MKILQPTRRQIDAFSHLLLDLGKILVASVVLGFFLPGLAGEVPFNIFAGGTLISVVSFGAGLILLKENSS